MNPSDERDQQAIADAIEAEFARRVRDMQAGIYTSVQLEHDFKCARKMVTGPVVGEVWVPARPYVIWHWRRIKSAWLVLIGKADAVTWV